MSSVEIILTIISVITFLGIGFSGVVYLISSGKARQEEYLRQRVTVYEDENKHLARKSTYLESKLERYEQLAAIVNAEIKDLQQRTEALEASLNTPQNPPLREPNQTISTPIDAPPPVVAGFSAPEDPLNPVGQTKNQVKRDAMRQSRGGNRLDNYLKV